jgi:hypothetical protein
VKRLQFSMERAASIALPPSSFRLSWGGLDLFTGCLFALPAAERKRCASINFDAFVELELS